MRLVDDEDFIDWVMSASEQGNGMAPGPTQGYVCLVCDIFIENPGIDKHMKDKHFLVVDHKSTRTGWIIKQRLVR
jgi:hypothetical protein